MISSGKYVGSGQICQSGSRAIVIIWDWPNRKEIGRYQMHKVCFCSNSLVPIQYYFKNLVLGSSAIALLYIRWKTLN